ncbi:MAG: hypothetical protein IKS83_09260 [Victivallales bacterium]|nr:hypothetical protein [Victivallales bacterium]
MKNLLKNLLGIQGKAPMQWRNDAWTSSEGYHGFLLKRQMQLFLHGCKVKFSLGGHGVTRVP